MAVSHRHPGCDRAPAGNNLPAEVTFERGLARASARCAIGGATRHLASSCGRACAEDARQRELTPGNVVVATNLNIGCVWKAALFRMSIMGSFRDRPEVRSTGICLKHGRSRLGFGRYSVFAGADICHNTDFGCPGPKWRTEPGTFRIDVE